jgi:hypothetical protein
MQKIAISALKAISQAMTTAPLSPVLDGNARGPYVNTFRLGPVMYSTYGIFDQHSVLSSCSIPAVMARSIASIQYSTSLFAQSHTRSAAIPCDELNPSFLERPLKRVDGIERNITSGFLKINNG